MDAAVFMDAAAMLDAALDMVAVVMLDKATHVVARAASGVVRLAAGFTEVAVVDSTAAVAAASMVAVDMAAEDTGNL
jgi:alkylhydroperoxidase family enzyme